MRIFKINAEGSEPRFLRWVVRERVRSTAGLCWEYRAALRERPAAEAYVRAIPNSELERDDNGTA